MDREPVDSTCLRSAGYDETSGELEVEFTDNSVYTYEGVHVFHFFNMLRSASPGWYFNRYIRNNHPFYGS